MSILPIYTKIFERLLYSDIFGFFLDKGLISANQSGFKPGDSCINQSLSITIIFTNILMMVMMLEMFSLTFGTIAFYSNYKKM